MTNTTNREKNNIFFSFSSDFKLPVYFLRKIEISMNAMANNDGENVKAKNRNAVTQSFATSSLFTHFSL